MRRARAAAINLIPTTTGATRALGKVLPELEGKIGGLAIRAPIPVGSIVDLVVQLSRPAARDEVNAAFRNAAEGSLAGIIGYADEPLVSTDIVGSPYSCVFDSELTSVRAAGEDARLVRQRVGLQLPPRRPRRADRSGPMTALSREQLVSFLGEMLLIRRFEEKVTDASVAFAQAGTDPTPEDALKYVYAPTPAPKAPAGAERQR